MQVDGGIWVRLFQNQMTRVFLLLVLFAFTSALALPLELSGAARQSGDLSLVEIHQDTVLWLVEIMVLLRQLSDAIRTQLKAFLAFCCVFITEGWLLRTERIYYRRWGQQYNDPTYNRFFHALQLQWISNLEYSTLLPGHSGWSRRNSVQLTLLDSRWTMTLKLQDSRLERRFSMEMRSITMMSPSSMKNMEAMKTFMIDDSFSFK